MTHEEARRLLDEFIDGELEDDGAAAVRDHIEGCDECRGEARSIKIISLALGRLPAETLRVDEREHLERSIREIAERRARRRIPALTWLAAAAIVVIVAAIGIPLALSGGKPAGEAGPAEGAASVQSESVGEPEATSGQDAAASGFAVGPQPVVVSRGRSYEDTGAIDEAFRADERASSFIGSYKASDVGAIQRQMQESVNIQAPKGAGRSPAECMNWVFRSVNRPLLPAYVERAEFAGTDAWVLVFAFAPDTSPDALLSETLIYVFAEADCALLATAAYR